MLLSASEAANQESSASNTSDCVLEMNRQKKNLRKNTELLHSPSAAMIHTGMVFICVCVWEQRMVYVYEEAPRPPTTHIIQSMSECGTLAEAAVQMNSTHSKTENKARFEETSWHSAADDRQ